MTILANGFWPGPDAFGNIMNCSLSEIALIGLWCFFLFWLRCGLAGKSPLTRGVGLVIAFIAGAAFAVLQYRIFAHFFPKTLDFETPVFCFFCAVNGILTFNLGYPQLDREISGG